MALSGVHVGRVVPDTKHTNMKFLAACICGTEGRFATQQQATDWMQAHLSGSDANGINHNGTWKA